MKEVTMHQKSQCANEVGKCYEETEYKGEKVSQP